MAETTANYKRYRFNVPLADESTIAWCETQVSLSTSLRQLIRAEIERNGYVDAMCVPVQQIPRPGRPAGSPNKKSNLEENQSQTETQAKEEMQTPMQTQAQPVQTVPQSAPMQPASASIPAPAPQQTAPTAQQNMILADLM